MRNSIINAGNRLRDLEFDLTITNSYNGGSGWTITATADALGVSISWGDSDPDAFTEIANEAVAAVQTYLENNDYNASSVISGITQSEGKWYGTPVYSGPYVTLMTYINAGWDGVGGETDPPVSAANKTEAVDVMVTYLLGRPDTSIPVFMDAIETNYPDIYTEVMAEYIDQKVGSR